METREQRKTFSCGIGEAHGQHAESSVPLPLLATVLNGVGFGAPRGCQVREGLLAAVVAVLEGVSWRHRGECHLILARPLKTTN